TRGGELPVGGQRHRSHRPGMQTRLAERVPTPGVPELYRAAPRAVRAAGDKTLAVGAECHCPDWTVLLPEAAHSPGRHALPERHGPACPVRMAGAHEEPFAIRAESEGVDTARQEQLPHRLAGAPVPNVDFPVVAANGDQVAGGMKGDGEHPAGVIQAEP